MPHNTSRGSGLGLEVFSKGNENVQAQCCAVFHTEFTSYSFCVSDGRHKWAINKRYSEFHALDKELSQRYPKAMTGVVSLPSKTAFGSMSPSLINARQKGLDAYLKDLLRQGALQQAAEIVDFLELPMEAALEQGGGGSERVYEQKSGGSGASTSPRTDLSQAATTPAGSVRVRAWQAEAEAKWGERDSMIV